MKRFNRWCNEFFYPGIRSDADDRALREKVLGLLEADHRLLDLGAGAGILPFMDFRGRVAHVAGIDPDERVLENPYLDEARVGLGESVPWESGKFDVVVADNVLEHLTDPDAVFREVHRVLRPGGLFVAKTPNLWHYMPWASRLIPFRFHYRLLRGLTTRADADVFPTRYRANSPRALRGIAQRCGLRVRSIDFFDGRPGYLAFNPLTYLLGCFYGMAVRHVPGLHRFASVLIVVMEKPA